MSKHPQPILLYCDGACLGNPGPGGWAALLQTRHGHQIHEKLIAGAEEHTTNNRMELKAALEGLKALKKPCTVEVYSDSKYVVRGMSEWIKQWIQNSWKTAAKKPVENRELWEALHAASEPHTITWHWVKGHAGHPENERVDEAARQAAERILCEINQKV